MKLPISVIVPLSKHRIDFFKGFCLPSIEANHPEEIIIIDEEGSAPHKRNKGASMAKCPYVFFCDDDTILKSTMFKRMYDTLEKEKDCSFAYCNAIIVNIHPDCKPKFTNRGILAKPWNLEELKMLNYIDTASLIRKKDFIGFDESFPRYEDWDLWISMGERGMKGAFINEILFFSMRIDKGISNSVPHHIAYAMLCAKHKIPPIVRTSQEDAT